MRPVHPFCFLVLAAQQPWPYYSEVAYAAWSEEPLVYNVFGNVVHPYDMDWSFLEVFNQVNHERVLVSDAGPCAVQFGQEDEVLVHPDPALDLAQVWQVCTHLTQIIPHMYAECGNVAVAGWHGTDARAAAAVARLLMRRLGAERVWDAQQEDLLDLAELTARYLGDPLASDTRADDARRVFATGAAWHVAHPERALGWWRTTADVHADMHG